MAARTLRVEIRVTKQDRAVIEAAACARGETLSEFVRGATQRAAERVLAERSGGLAADERVQRFLAALERPGVLPRK